MFYCSIILCFQKESVSLYDRVQNRVLLSMIFHKIYTFSVWKFNDSFVKTITFIRN